MYAGRSVQNNSCAFLVFIHMNCVQLLIMCVQNHVSYLFPQATVNSAIPPTFMVLIMHITVLYTAMLSLYSCIFKHRCVYFCHVLILNVYYIIKALLRLSATSLFKSSITLCIITLYC